VLESVPLSPAPLLLLLDEPPLLLLLDEPPLLPPDEPPLLPPDEPPLLPPDEPPLLLLDDEAVESSPVPESVVVPLPEDELEQPIMTVPSAKNPAKASFFIQISLKNVATNAAANSNKLVNFMGNCAPRQTVQWDCRLRKAPTTRARLASSHGQSPMRSYTVLPVSQ
jgi:hypothetical protein